MDTRIKIGCFFFGLAAFLYSTRHITAAIMVININSERANYFDGAYHAVGWGITIWTILAFLTGLIFFGSGVLRNFAGPFRHNDRP